MATQDDETIREKLYNEGIRLLPAEITKMTEQVSVHLLLGCDRKCMASSTKNSCKTGFLL